MKELNKLIQKRFDELCQTGKLFRVAVTGDQIWNAYLNGFANDKTFRDPESSEHNCNHCKNFIRRYGNVVAIIDDKIESIFKVDANEEYETSIKAMTKLVETSQIKDVFIETHSMLNSLPYEVIKNTSVYALGVKQNFKKYTQEEADKFGVVQAGKVYTFNHMMVSIPGTFIDKSGDSTEKIQARYRDKYEVLFRGLNDITVDTLETVKDLIGQNSILNGTAYLYDLMEFLKIKKEFNLAENKEFFTRLTSYDLNERIAKFRNTLIGVLCIEIEDKLDLNTVCLNWNKRADPINYRKATAPITQKQIEEAQKFVIENGYEDSFKRRLATMDDIASSEVLHLNSTSEVKAFDIFANVKPTTVAKALSFDNVRTVSIDDFMKDILPNSKSLEVYFDKKHKHNLCALTTSEDKDSKSIFKYNNNFSKTFIGNLAGKSYLAESVRDQGGNVDGVLRFSMMWAYNNNNDDSDLDAHCTTPRGTIYYGNKRVGSGVLDIDIIHPQDHIRSTGKDVVENIVFTKIDQGKYGFIVNQFSARRSQGFKAEIEFEGNVYEYEYNQPVSSKVRVATVENGKITHHITPKVAKPAVHWNITENEFHKVNLVCLSPNYWGENKFGNKHYMFMLEDCKAVEEIRSFHNEDLNNDLIQHRKVMEVLGNTTRITPTDDQLSGFGFNATVKDDLIVKVDNKLIKIQF